MNRDELLISFDLLNIKDPFYILADGLELWLLLNDEDFLSRSEIETLAGSENNIDQENALADSDLEDEIINRKNKIDKIWSLVSSHFKMRVKAPLLVKYYPFEFTDKLILKRNWQNKPEYKLYLNLLVATRLKFLDKSKQQKMASDFEQICKIALQGWLPDFDCKLFGWGSDDRKNFFGINLRDAFIKLAYFINEKPDKDEINERKNNDFCLSSSGDNGLDLVGVQKFPDQQRGAMVIFGQCTCTSKSQILKKKTFDAHVLNFRDYIKFSNNPINMVFIPAMYRDNNNDFIKEAPLKNCLLVDRQRLLTMIKPEHIQQMPLNSFEIA